MKLKTAAVAVIIGAWFLGQTFKGLRIYFTPDDLMNMYWAWLLPLPKLLLANLTPFTSVYRPLGSLLYRELYLSGGLNPLSFRIAAYVLMMLNIWLIYRLARLLTGSAEIAILCALLGAYHRRLMDLFLNNGTIYDILCFTFFYLTLIYYVALSQKFGGFNIRRTLIFCFLYTLALNSKEMAVTLPVVLLAYEIIYHPPARGALSKWLNDRRPVWIAAIMTAIAIRMKTAPGGSFAGNSYYAVDLSVQQYFNTTMPLLNHLFFLPDPDHGFTRMQVIILFTALWTIAAVTRSKPLLLAAAIITVTPLPINFIVYRGFFVMYIPLVGWVLYFATLLVGARDWLLRVPSPSWAPRRVALFLATACALFVIQAHDRFWTFDRVDPAQFLIRDLKKDLIRIRPSLAANGSVLFLGDAFQPGSWDPLYVVRLLYRNPGIPVDRVKMMPPGSDPARMESYSLVLDYCSGRYVEIISPGGWSRSRPPDCGP